MNEQHNVGLVSVTVRVGLTMRLTRLRP